MNEDVLLSAIQSDFTVDLLAHTHDRALFGALRRDVWHFVHWESVHGDHAIAQYHVPRFVLAEVLDGLLDPARPDAHVQPQEQGACELLWRGVGICVKPGNRIALTVQQTQIDLPGAYCEAMLEDVAVLIAARNLVTAEGDLYVLPTQDTHHGNPVAHPARQLIEAIAFEGEVRGQFEAHEFALYSAFCTQRDFSLEEQISLPSARDAVEIQFGQFDVEDIPADVMDAVLGVQDALFPGRIWGPGIAPDVPAAARTLAEGLAKLNEEQRTQYVLLSGMYNAGVLVVLAAVLGFLAFERYAALMAQGLAPDSEDEQAIRTDLAFIELFGQLAR